ncbi:MAG: alpha/beta hydrolase [Candidatus Pacearchaeota archaeon]
MATVLFIHGMMGGGWYWEKYKSFFESKGIKCFAPDLRYHSKGGSAVKELGTTSVRDYVSDLKKEVERISKEEGEIPFIVGHSMGGLIAQLLVSDGYGKGGVFLTPAPPAGIMALSYSQILTFLPVMIKSSWWKKPFKLSYDKFRYSILNNLEEEESRKIYPNFCYESGRALFEIGMWILDKSKATKVDFSKVSVPVMIIGARKDKITPISIVRKIKEKYKNARYEELENNAHWVVGEKNWQNVAELVLDFIKS